MATPRKMGAGRPTEYERKIEIACKRLSETALKYLIKVLADDTVETRWRMQAAKEIMDRGLGRPKQSMDQKITLVGGDAFMDVVNAAKQRVIDASGSITMPPVEPSENLH